MLFSRAIKDHVRTSAIEHIRQACYMPGTMSLTAPGLYDQLRVSIFNKVAGRLLVLHESVLAYAHVNILHDRG